MEAFEYLKELKRMCKSIDDCDICPLSGTCHSSYLIDKELKQQVDAVEKWSKEHPIKTRQSELLKLFPNAPLYNAILTMCPQDVDRSIKDFYCDNKTTCDDCKKQFWLTPIDTNDITEEAK